VAPAFPAWRGSNGGGVVAGGAAYGLHGTAADIADAIAEAAVQSTEEEFAELTGMLIKERARFARALRHYRGLNGLIAAVTPLLEVSPIHVRCGDCRRLRGWLLRWTGRQRAMTALLAGGQQTSARSGHFGLAPEFRPRASGFRPLSQPPSSPRPARSERTWERAGAHPPLPERRRHWPPKPTRLLALDDLCGRITVARATAALYGLPTHLARVSPPEGRTRAARL
jgi:hypothetical protein